MRDCRRETMGPQWPQPADDRPARDKNVTFYRTCEQLREHLADGRRVSTRMLDEALEVAAETGRTPAEIFARLADAGDEPQRVAALRAKATAIRRGGLHDSPRPDAGKGIER